MLKREALEILGMADDPDLQAVSARTFDICEYLLVMHERGELKTDFGPVPETVTYHAPCQQQGHGIGKPALDLLALVPELGRSRRRRLLRSGRHLRPQAREVRHRHEGGRRAVRGDRRRAPGPDRVRLGDLPLAYRGRNRVALGASGRDAPPRVGAERLVVGLVIVSHSAALAEGVCELAREMGGGRGADRTGRRDGGRRDGDGRPARAEAVERVRSPDGVLS